MCGSYQHGAYTQELRHVAVYTHGASISSGMVPFRSRDHKTDCLVQIAPTRNPEVQIAQTRNPEVQIAQTRNPEAVFVETNCT